MSLTTTTAERLPSPIVEVRHQLDAMRGQFEMALPGHITVDKFVRVVLTAVQNTPELLQCDRRSLWNAAVKAAQDGLLPDGREGAMVVRFGKGGKTANWQPMIAGIRKKVRNSGEIATWDVHVVHQKDQFEFRLGDDPFISHAPSLDEDPGPTIAVYSIAVLKSGEKSRDVMSMGAIRKIRDEKSDGWKAFKAGKIKSTPWSTDEDEMAKKTVARRHSKVLPMSTDIEELLHRDDDTTLTPINEPVDRARSLAGRLDALAAMTAAGATNGESDEVVDVETGEVTEAAAAQPQPTAAQPVSDQQSTTTQPPVDQQATEAIVEATETEGEIDLATEEFHEAEQAPPREPDDEASYLAYAVWHIEYERNPENLKAWFIGDAQKRLRHDCKVGKAVFEAVQAKAKARIAALISKPKAA